MRKKTNVVVVEGGKLVVLAKVVVFDFEKVIVEEVDGPLVRRAKHLDIWIQEVVA
jgi:hypothetical protein